MPDDYVCNGCGASDAFLDFVPDTIYGISVFESCRRHDWAYSVGGNTEAFNSANREFLNNLLTEVEAGNKWYIPTFLARWRVMTYYSSVVSGGKGSFKWSGRDA